jgi:hypothetical protein
MSELIVVREHITWKVAWRLEKYLGEIRAASQPYDVVVGEGNLLLNAGGTEVAKLIVGDGTAVAFSAANARIGVGDSATAAAVGQTDLQAGANKAYAAMNASYPQVSAQTMSFQADFGTAVANFAWQEWVIDNKLAAGTKALNRKVTSLGTKTSANTWRFGVTITVG